jgi:transcriptional regulator with XRE-family HTH domain
MEMTINDRIRVSLKVLGITQRDFSKETKITESRLSRLLSNKGKMSAKEAVACSKALKVPLECLIGDVPLFEAMLEDYKDCLWD